VGYDNRSAPAFSDRAVVAEAALRTAMAESLPRDYLCDASHDICLA
jgi:hypothetical protein